MVFFEFEFNVCKIIFKNRNLRIAFESTKSIELFSAFEENNSIFHLKNELKNLEITKSNKQI